MRDPVDDTGPYRLQALIAACHAAAPRPEDTDWPQIATLYAALALARPSPVVELNRAVAVAMADGPDAGLRLLEPLAADLDRYHLFHAARADLLRRAGDAPTRPTRLRSGAGAGHERRRAPLPGAPTAGPRRPREARCHPFVTDVP